MNKLFIFGIIAGLVAIGFFAANANAWFGNILPNQDAMVVLNTQVGLIDCPDCVPGPAPGAGGCTATTVGTTQCVEAVPPIGPDDRAHVWTCQANAGNPPTYTWHDTETCAKGLGCSDDETACQGDAIPSSP